MRAGLTAALVTITFVTSGVLLAATSTSEQNVLKGHEAFGGWQKDKPGVRRLLKPEDQPPVGESTSNPVQIVKRAKHKKPIAPKGFSVDLIASGLAEPRVIRVAPNGDLFVADSEANTIRVYRVASGSGRPIKSETYASGLNKPFGIAFYPLGPNPEWVYVANTDGVVRFPYKNGDLKASGKPEDIVEKIPSTHHWTRDLVFSPDGKRMFVSVGSGSNVALDMSPEPEIKGGLASWKKTRPLGATWDTEERRADVLSFTPEGKDEKIFAAGLRNCAGLTVQPATGELWCAVNERDEIGDDVPFEYATHVKEGAFYGWPWFYIGGNEDPHHKGERTDLKDKVTVPDVLIEAHSAPLQIAFYDGDSFPSEYKGDAFVTLHGSWNRGQRSGNKVVRLLFKDGKPTGEYEDFLTGFVISNEKAWGRPVGIAAGQDGSLFVTDDGSGTIWRVSYRKAGTTAETAPSKELATEGRPSRKGKFRVAQQAMAHDDQPPLPERNPVRAGASALKTPPPPGEAPTIPWSDAEIAAAKAKCTEALSSIKLDYKLLPPIKEGLCGAPAPILLKSLGSDTKVEIDPPATVTCALAKALSIWLSETVQPEAEVLFNSRVVKLHNATSYACRNRYSSAYQPLSEHALANALDVSEFVLASGEHITVLDSWPKVVSTPPAPVPNPAREPEVKAAKPTGVKASVVTAAKAKAVAQPSPPPIASEPTPNPKAEFVKHVHDEACHEFGTVLGPEANDAHKNHFHLDMKERRSGFCQ
jgi:glucose/arabinose dehydrogenase